MPSFEWKRKIHIYPTRLSSAITFSSTPSHPPHLQSSSSGSRVTLISPKTTPSTLLQRSNHCSPLLLLIVLPPLSKISNPVTVPLSTPAGTDSGSSLSSNEVRSIKTVPIPWLVFFKSTFSSRISHSRPSQNRPYSSHSLLFLGLFSPPLCLYCQKNDIICTAFLFLPPASHLHALVNNHEFISNSLNYLRSTYSFNSI